MNSVTIDEIVAAEIDILYRLDWNLQLIICPIEISINIAFLLDLHILNSLKGFKGFCESITNFIIWTTWNQYSYCSISLTGIVIFCELSQQHSDIRKLLSYIGSLSAKVDRNLLAEVLEVRAFMLGSIGSITEDKNLINKVEVIKRISSLEVYLQLQ